MLAQSDFLSSPLGKKLIDSGLYFITNPGDFLFDLHHDAMDYTPLPKDKIIGIHTNLLLLANPALVNSVCGKVALKEGRRFPQIGGYGGIWKTYLLEALTGSSESISAELSGWSAGIFIAKEVQPGTRLFANVNYSRVSLNVAFSEPIDIVPGVLTFSSLSAGVLDTYIFTGIEHVTGAYEDKLLIAETGYGLRNNKIVAKILLHTGLVELGLTIYPEGLLVIHPVLNLQVKF